MDTQAKLDYDRIAEAINYIKQNFKQQPTLEEIAEKIHLSPFHFQRLFTDWAGVSPKKFIQYMSLEYAKHILKNQQTTLFDATYETGLSSTSRLHDLFIKIEGMTPAEYKNGGENLTINYSHFESPFGKILIASTQKGICAMFFYENEQKVISELQKMFPKAHFVYQKDKIQENAFQFFNFDSKNLTQIKLHLKGTAFQLKVWETLLKIPVGKLESYGKIAQQIENPNASRAVGTAIGTNPVAFLIPCHRVIQAKGTLGGYLWGETRKTAIIGWEASKLISE